jgi:DNA replication protein DnaC
MQDRIFVLKPMLDLNLEWIHPVFQKDVAELLFETKDKSECIVVQSIDSPLRKINLEQFNYVAFEGNIGAGKTTLATKIAEDFNAKSVLERFADNPCLFWLIDTNNCRMIYRNLICLKILL